MAANNTAPIFTGIPDIQWIIGVLTANTTTDLTAGTSYLVFTADADNGGYVSRLKFRAAGTNTATVARIWLNNGSTTGTAANNVLIDEITLSATTVSQVVSLQSYEAALNFPLPPGYRIYVTLGTGVAAGYGVTCIGGKYKASA